MSTERNSNQISLQELDKQSERVDLWSLEALRTLVLFSTAGLAGAVTLAANGQIRGMDVAMYCFVAAMAAALLGIVIGWAAHCRLYHVGIELHQKFTKETLPKERNWLNGLFWSSYIAASASAILLLLGCVSLACAITTQQT